MSATHFNLIVIGAGPGGYVAAIRAAQLGLSVACIEREPKLGGTCLRVGCIPSKALLESSERYEEVTQHYAQHGIDVEGVALNLDKMMARKSKIVNGLTSGVAYLFKKNKVTRFEGHATITAVGKVSVKKGEDTTTLSCDKILIATGSVSSSLPGLALDGDRIGDSTAALSYPSVPKHLVVIGAGVIGLELGSVWARLGAKVTVLEYMDSAMPGMDRELANEAVKIFKKQGIEFRFGVKVTGARVEGEGCVVEYEGGEPLACDRVLVAVGRRPNTDDLGIEALGLDVNRRGALLVNEHFETNLSGIYALSLIHI